MLNTPLEVFVVMLPGYQNPPQGRSLDRDGSEGSSAITTEQPLDRSFEY
jgi:hypothetical protein